MFRDPNTWNNQESVPEGSSDADDSLLFLQKHYEPIENKDDGFESYSIKARKFKEIQYLRQLNAQSNNPNEEKAPQNIFQRQTFYNDLAIGDDEPVKPGNIDYTDDFRNNNNTVTSAMSAMSDRRDFSNQGPQSSSWRIVSGSKQNLDSTPSQSFRIKRDTCITQDFSEATPTANDGYSTGKSKAGSQYGYYAGLNAVETNKAGSLRDINQKFRGTARSIILVEDEEKEIQNKRKMLLPKPPVADVKKRPQSKDANRLLYSQNAGDLRPNTTNPKNNKRLVIKARNSQILNMESGYTSPDKTKESSDQNVSEGFELSLVNSPFNQQLNKTNLSPIRSESVRSSFTYMESKANIANNAQNVGNQNMGTKVLTRVIQPFNKNFDDSPMAPGLSLEKNKGMSSSDKPAGSTMTNSMKKGRNENINSIADSKDPLAKQRNMRGVPEEIVRNNDPLKQHLKPQSQKKPENKPQPKTPPKVALMKVNNNMKVEQLIKGKKTYNHKTNMTEYLKRRGLKENTKIFCFNSRDEYIRRALKKFGWVENPHLNSFLFDFKWTYTDTEVDYANLMDGQFFNHFQNNKEITTKSGLIENVRSCADHGTGFWSFFPRAYDLGHINQMKEFQEDFERTALMNLLKKHWEYIKSKADPCVIRKIKEKFRTKQEKLAREGIIDIFKKKKLIKNVVYAEEVTRKDFIMYLSLLETALNCARTLVHQHKNVAEADNYFALSTLNERARSALLTYSKYNPPYDTIPLATRKSLGGGEEQWETPNELMIYKVYKFKELIKKFSPQYKIDGIQNTWIIKASGNARGSGIFLTDKLEEALDSGMKNQARIIQKYIENPLVIKDFPFKPMNNKKFDIRQWVLVSSMNPLVIYMFSSCYLRICSQDFDLKDIKNQYSHLTNFSLNKGNFQGGVEESICHVDVLKDYLKYTKNIDWDSRIKPKIVDIIIKTISSASDSIEHRPGCFDVYGFDLLLDDKCQPWLLEVNLSPACSERAPWLIEMLDEMGEHLLKCILPADYLQVPENNNNEENKTPEPTKTDEQPPKEIQEKKSPKYSWDLIYKAEAPRDFANTNIMLEIAGVKANIRKEQEIDKKYYSHMAAIRIQKTYKMYRAKKLKLFLKQSKVIVVIQKYVRRFLAKALLKKLRETRARNIIKNLLEIQRINKRIIDFRRERAAIRIQKHGRGYLARKLFKHMNYVKDIIKIQSNWRRAIAVRKKLALRKELVMTIRIQRFWRKRFKMLKNKATKIRAYWKMWKARKAFLLFMKKKRSAIKMQCAVRMFLAKLCKQRLLIERAESKLKHLRVLKYGKKMFDGLQLSKKYTKFFQILNGIILKVSLKAIASRAEIRNNNACIIQGLVKIRKAKIRLRRLRRRKMIVRIQAFWRMYSKKKRYLMHKQIVRAVVFLQKNIRMFLAVCKLRDLQHERDLKEYALALQVQREEERMIEEQKEMERRKQDMIKKRQNYFKQKDHITFLHQSVPKSKQMAATKMNKTNTEAFNVEKKKQEILKNTEHMLKSIYKEMPLKPGTAMGKKPPTRGGMGGMNMMMPKKTEENSYQFSGPDENRNFDTLYKLFSKNTGFH